MKPSAINRCCAHPEGVCWVIGAVALNLAAMIILAREVSISVIFSDWQLLLRVGLMAVPLSLLGYIVGMFCVWPHVRRLCSRINSPDLEVGDTVSVLTGVHRGAEAEVYGFTKSQGGWEIARLELGQNHRDKFTDIFEIYALLKSKKPGEQDEDGKASPAIS